jgi:hypothetical protein
MLEMEYAKWVLTDTLKETAQAVAIYAVVLTAYWTLVA